MKLTQEQLAEIAPVILDPDYVIHRILTDVDSLSGCLSSKCGDKFGKQFRHTYSVAVAIASEEKLCEECW